MLYGHGRQSLPGRAERCPGGGLRHGGRLVTLTGVVNESAFIRDLQWDTYGTHVLHVDFTRISADELVKVHITVELRGEAPGVKDGGVVDSWSTTSRSSVRPAQSRRSSTSTSII